MQTQRQLQYQAQTTRDRVNDLHNQQIRIGQQLQNIANVQLPNARNDLANLQAQLPGAIQDVANAQQAADSASAAFENFKRSVNYDELDRQVSVTLVKVNQIKSSIADMQRQVRNDQQKIIDQTNLRDGLNKKIDATKLTISQKETRLGQVNVSLQEHDQLRSALDEKMAAAVKVRSDIQAELIAVLPQK